MKTSHDLRLAGLVTVCTSLALGLWAVLIFKDASGGWYVLQFVGLAFVLFVSGVVIYLIGLKK